jgi:LPXTG-site transpeptidase (sortase) family protein
MIDVEVTVEDGSGEQASTTFRITVSNVNDPPTIANPIPDQNTLEDQPFSFTFAENTFDDIDAGDSLTYSAKLGDNSDLPDWLAFDAGTRTFSGTPANADVGMVQVKVIAADSASATSAALFQLTVTNVNDAPHDITLSSVSVNENMGAGSQVGIFTGHDVDDSVLVFSLIPGALDNALFDIDGSQLNTAVEFNAEVKNSYQIRVKVEDPSGASYEETIVIGVNNVNDQPVADADSFALDEGATYSGPLNLLTNDQDEDLNTLTVNAITQSANHGVVTPNTDGSFSYVHDGSETTSDQFTYRVCDDGIPTLCDIAVVNIKINPVNDAPVVVNPITERTAQEDRSFLFQFSESVFTDAEGEAISYGAKLQDGSPLPGWLSFTADTRVFAGTPAMADIGTYHIRITASDIHSDSGTHDFVLTVQPVNDAPILDHPVDDQVVDEDQLFSFIIPENTFSDEEGDVLSYSAELTDGNPLPGWLTFDADTRTFSGIPLNDDVGVLVITIIVDDSNGGFANDEYTLTINNVNDGPTASSFAVSVVEEADKAIQLQGHDVDGDDLSYLITSLPAIGTLYQTVDGTTRSGEINASNTPVTHPDGIVLYNTGLDQVGDDLTAFKYLASDPWIDSNEAIVTINSSESNDRPTAIHLDHNDLDENNLVGDAIGRFNTDDIDTGDSHSYLLIAGEGSGDNALFSITGDALKANFAFDYENRNEYQIRVQSSDSFGETVEGKFDIFINDVNEPMSQLILSNNRIPESLPAGTPIGFLSHDDPDADDAWTYALTGGDVADFDIQIQEGIPLLVTQHVFSQSIKPTYSVEVTVEDLAGHQAIVTFEILVMLFDESLVNDDTGEMYIGEQIEIDVLFNDATSASASTWQLHSIVRPPNHGTAVIGSIIYTPDADFVGQDSLTYLACDNNGYCDIGLVNINVLPRMEDVDTLPVTGFAPNVVTKINESESNISALTDELSIFIPKLNARSSIVGVPYEDGQWDVSWLGNRAGYLFGSAYPTWEGNTVITAHVWNADGTEGLFRDIASLRYGDRIEIAAYGQKYVYSVREVHLKVSPESTDLLFKHEERDWVTLLTCSNFNEVTGSYDSRTIVRAVLIQVKNLE